MRKPILASILTLLAACGGGASSNASSDGANAAASNAATSAPAATPTDNAAAAAPSNALADLRRADEINECVQDVANELPAGTDVNAFCGCAVDRMTGGRGEREAMEACAAQMGIPTEGM